MESAPPQAAQPKRNRPLGLTIYASLNLALAAGGILGASFALMDSEAREILGTMPPIIGLVMASVLIGSSVGLLKGAGWGRTLLMCYAAVWLLDKLSGWEDAVMMRGGMTGQDDAGLVQFLLVLLVMTWLLFPLAKSKWMGFLSTDKPVTDKPDSDINSSLLIGGMATLGAYVVTHSVAASLALGFCASMWILVQRGAVHASRGVSEVSGSGLEFGGLIVGIAMALGGAMGEESEWVWAGLGLLVIVVLNPVRGASLEDKIQSSRQADDPNETYLS